MAVLPNAQLSHVGLFVRDLSAMTAFYCRTLGMVVTDRGPMMGRELAFLSRNPGEHHQLVMIHDPSRTEIGSALSQISFRLDDLESLRTYFALLRRADATGLEARNHGNSWSLYFFDPEGNKIELYVPTPWSVAQPWRASLDLDRPAEAIVEETRRLMADNPTSQPVEDWTREIGRRIAAAAVTAEASR
jgi:catechol 2,3-dioxygenase